MIKPMLADHFEPDKVVFPVLASPKYDGIRCLVQGMAPLTRSLKDIPNRFIREALSRAVFDGFDGELIVGSPTAPDCFRTTDSAVMSHGGQPNFAYYVFDFATYGSMHTKFVDRYRHLMLEVVAAQNFIDKNKVQVILVPQVKIKNHYALEQYEEEQLALGYEGVMIRQPYAPYKCGRSTVNQGYLLKVVRFETAEAEVIGFTEEMHNANPKTVNELGDLRPSKRAEGMEGKGTLGSFLVRNAKGETFGVGSGLTAAQRKVYWFDREKLIKHVITYKHKPVGAKDAPRTPIFKGFRDRRDM